MLARRTVRLATEPYRYHAATGWTGMQGDPEDPGEPRCADCRSTQCPRWLRVQARLDRQRWRLSGLPYGAAPSGGWGGDVPF